jgi:rare lipoprotein A
MRLLSSRLNLASIEKLILFIFACQLVMLVATQPLRAEDSTPAKEKTSEAEQVKTSSLEEEPAGKLGIARFYAKRFKGRRTSSGGIYNPRKLTAAHHTLPLGTRVKVVNLANKKSVIVTINDRCREHEDEFIDLSRQAARQLGMMKRGKAKVRIIPIEEDNETR